MNEVPETVISGKAVNSESKQWVQEEKRDLLVRLLSHLAHEIRNPLSSLNVHIQLLEEDVAVSCPELKQRSTDRFQIIQREIRRLESVVSRFMQLAGPSALELSLHSLNGLVSDTVELLQAQAGERDIELETDLAPDLPLLELDSIQITQALLNLLVNALQAVSTGGKVQVRTSLHAQDVVRLDVSDNGPGIPEDQMNRIFEPYYTTKTEGVGLGLWITQQVIRAHGGSIETQSAVARGATFTMLLPCPVKPREEPRQTILGSSQLGTK